MRPMQSGRRKQPIRILCLWRESIWLSSFVENLHKTRSTWWLAPEALRFLEVSWGASGPEHEFISDILSNLIVKISADLQSSTHREKTIYSLENQHLPWKAMVGRCISYWNSPFLGDMLVFGGVTDKRHLNVIHEFTVESCSSMHAHVAALLRKEDSPTRIASNVEVLKHIYASVTWSWYPSPASHSTPKEMTNHGGTRWTPTSYSNYRAIISSYNPTYNW